MSKRVAIDDYAMMLALVASLRSEDPFRKVGAVALDKDKYVLGLAYNGLKAGVKVKTTFWKDRDARRKFMIHAEQNLCALFRRGTVHTVAVTTCPCQSCATLLVAHGVKRVLFGEPYADSDGEVIFKNYGLDTVHIPIAGIRESLAAGRPGS